MEKETVYNSGTGSLATTVGESKVMVFTPTRDAELEEILSSGDTGATLTTILSGQQMVFTGSLSCTLLAATSLRVTKFTGTVKAGTPITVNYTAGSTATPLTLTFVGKGHKVRC